MFIDRLREEGGKGEWKEERGVERRREEGRRDRQYFEEEELVWELVC